MPLHRHLKCKGGLTISLVVEERKKPTIRDDVIGVKHLRLLKQLTRLIIAREN